MALARPKPLEVKVKVNVDVAETASTVARSSTSDVRSARAEPCAHSDESGTLLHKSRSLSSEMAPSTSGATSSTLAPSSSADARPARAEPHAHREESAKNVNGLEFKGDMYMRNKEGEGDDEDRGPIFLAQQEED